MRASLLAWTMEIDPERTRAIYGGVEAGAAVRCGCLHCRNFHAARPEHYPLPLREFLTQLAVDPTKEAAVGLVSPLERGLNLYSGSYIFCGEILAGRPHRGFPFLNERVDVFECLHPHVHLSLRTATNPGQGWAGSGCVRLEFLVVLPWVLAEQRGGVVDLDTGSGRPTS